MKQILVLILICLLSVSCMTVKRIERNCDQFEQICTTGNVDTVRIETITKEYLRDTTINFYFPRDTVYLKTPMNKIPGVKRGLINSKLSYLEAGLAWSTAQVEQGVLKHYLESGDTIIRLQLDNVIKERETLRTELKASKSYVTIKENTNWANLCIKIVWGLFVVIILALGWLVLKNKAKLIGLAKKLF